MLSKINSYKEVIIFYLLLIIILFVVSIHNNQLEANKWCINDETLEVCPF